MKVCHHFISYSYKLNIFKSVKQIYAIVFSCIIKWDYKKLTRN